MRNVDAVVIGGGMAGLVAAWQLTQAGLKPVLVESRGYTGGLVAGSQLAGIAYDIGAEGWATRRPDTSQLATELGLVVEPPVRQPSWVWFDDGAFAMPSDAVLGIPSDVTSADVVTAIGGKAADLAAELDSRPVPDEVPESLGELVRTRLGEEVLTRLVGPIAGGIHAAAPDLLSADVVAPGLRAGLVRTGSLQQAVAAQVRIRGDSPVVASVAGGMFRMPQTLHEQIEAAGGRILTRTGAKSISVSPTGLEPGASPTTAGAANVPTPDGHDAQGGRWLVTTAATSRNPNPSLPPIPDGEPVTYCTDRVIVACSAAPALDLLSDVIDVTGPALTAGAPIAHVNLALQAPELDGAPRGGGMLVAPGSTIVKAKALTHLSRKWPSLGASCPSHVHLVRVSYGRKGEKAVPLSVEQALTDASVLFGVKLTSDQLLDSAIIHWDGALAPTTPRTRAWVQELHARLEKMPGLALTGAWASGSGIGALVPHARTAARKLA
ncbi:protoporphyrinogen/coproporphyrinogen oxidase [Cutibacterium granulosum]|uniref:protoporphyrinogen/coproporphyrinogen oxidase n=1 Tax=Cutibacterium granulosum TaxID=33011 RepID=UPI002B2274F7|nr:FAD-dependent oxidoreductase [Cutibacterium granulosum]MEA5639512.1 FAD-dependent oxidoreductase [Cutibacterium granulosum]